MVSLIQVQALFLSIYVVYYSRTDAISVRSKACRIGTFEAGNACIPCPKNTFSDVEGLTECKKCPAGSTSLKGSKSLSDCIPCSEGTFFKNDDCEACPNDTFNDQEGAVECTPCPKGTVSAMRSTQCRTCPVGKRVMRKARVVLCENCPAGSTTLKESSEGCVPCPAGTFQNERTPFRGSGKCQPCRPGTFADKPGSVTCKECPDGFYQNGLGGKSCIKCPNQSITAKGAKFCKSTCDPLTSGCISCSAGEGFISKESKCKKCPKGSVSPPGSTTPCYPCPAGEGMANKEQTDCVCEPGQRLKKGGICEDCPFLFTSLDGAKCVCAVPLLPDGRCACPDGDIFDREENKCISQSGCPVNSILDFDGNCKKCPGDSMPDQSGDICDCGKPGFGLRNIKTDNERCERCRPGEKATTLGVGNRPTVIACVPCLRLTFNDKPGATKCKGCPKGQKPLREGATSCLTPCPPNARRDQGFFDEDETCTCKSGFASEGKDLLLKCTQCSRNEVVFDNKCVCPSGKFAGPERLCMKCPRNGFVDGDRCMCFCGFILNNETGECEACPPGSFDDGGKCSPCPEGEIAPDEGSCSCSSCRPGLTSFERIRCVRQCTKGFFRNKKGKCISCSTGQRVEGQECVVCPDNSVSQGGNVSKCTECKADRVPNKEKSRCTKV